MLSHIYQFLDPDERQNFSELVYWKDNSVAWQIDILDSIPGYSPAEGPTRMVKWGADTEYLLMLNNSNSNKGAIYNYFGIYENGVETIFKDPLTNANPAAIWYSERKFGAQEFFDMLSNAGGLPMP